MPHEALSDGQVERFHRLVWPCLPMVLRMATLLTHDANEAEDLAQETMLKALRGIDGFKEGTNLSAWLATILRRAHIDAFRSTRQERDHVPLDGAPELADVPAGESDGEWSSPQELLERFEDRDVIAALQELPEEIRWTLLLVDVEQMDHAEAAAVLAVPVGTIKSRAHRGRGMLRDRLRALGRSKGWWRSEEKR